MSEVKKNYFERFPLSENAIAFQNRIIIDERMNSSLKFADELRFQLIFSLFANSLPQYERNL